jgi:hypothetical protein
VPALQLAAAKKIPDFQCLVIGENMPNEYVCVEWNEKLDLIYVRTSILAVVCGGPRRADEPQGRISVYSL